MESIFSQIVRPIRPCDHIRNKQQLQHLECSVCFQVKSNLVSCKGPCHKPFCLNCVTKIKKMKNQCPHRCSQSFSIESASHYQVSYNCPYEPHKCKASLNNLQQFKSHCFSCPFIPANYKHDNQQKKNYQCTIGHLLIYMTPDIKKHFYQQSLSKGELMRLKCAICQESQVIQSFCPECSQKKENYVAFCRNCRVAPCTKTQCPLGHTLDFNDEKSKGITCDLCGVGVIAFEEVFFSDRKCDFDICFRCFQNLPEHNHLIPLKNIFAGFESQKQDPNKNLQKMKKYINLLQNNHQQPQIPFFLPPPAMVNNNQVNHLANLYGLHNNDHFDNSDEENDYQNHSQEQQQNDEQQHQNQQFENEPNNDSVDYAQDHHNFLNGQEQNEDEQEYNENIDFYDNDGIDYDD